MRKNLKAELIKDLKELKSAEAGEDFGTMLGLEVLDFISKWRRILKAKKTNQKK